MKIISSILLNAFILFLIAFLLSSNDDIGITNGVVLGCKDCSYFSSEAWKTYIIGGVILGLINLTIKPLLKLVSLPFFFFFFGLTIFIVNAIILKLFSYIINDILWIHEISYTIDGWVNFVIAVAIFTILNMVYSLLFFKK